MPENSIDLEVTNPPYALTSINKRFSKNNSKEAKYGKDGSFQRLSKGFMGKEWDGAIPSVDIWKEVLSTYLWLIIPYLLILIIIFWLIIG